MTSSPILFYSGLATRPALDAVIIPAFQAATDVMVAAEYNPTSVFIEMIAHGARPDVVFGTSEAVRALAESGSVRSGTAKAVVRSSIGIASGLRDRSPAVSTTEELVATLLGARSVAYSASGASGIYFRTLLEQLRIADAVNSRATVIPDGLTANCVVDGRADIAVQQLSELRAVPGVQVRPLPDSVQKYTEFSTAVATESHARAGDFAHFLGTEFAKAAYTEIGLEALRPR